MAKNASQLWAIIIVAVAAGVATAGPAAAADDQLIEDLADLADLIPDDTLCQTAPGTTLCADGVVRGSYGAPTYVPTYDSRCYADDLVTARRLEACSAH